jgi:hypothetical protein
LLNVVYFRAALTKADEVRFRRVFGRLEETHVIVDTLVNFLVRLADKGYEAVIAVPIAGYI